MNIFYKMQIQIKMEKLVAINLKKWFGNVQEKNKNEK